MQFRNTLLLAALVLSAASMATQVKLDYDGVTGLPNGSIYAGLINVKESTYSGTNWSSWSSPFGVYCLTPSVTLQDGWTYDKTQDAPPVNGQVAYIAYTYRTEKASSWDPYQLAGAQLAIWSLSSSYDVANSGFSKDARDYAATVLAASANHGYSKYDYYTPALTTGGKAGSQTLIRATEGGTVSNPVPEPFTLFLGVGALGAAVKARRSARRV